MIVNGELFAFMDVLLVLSSNSYKTLMKDSMKINLNIQLNLHNLEFLNLNMCATRSNA